MLPIHFAPLQGYTDAPYRNVHHKMAGGIAHYYTAFIRLEHGKIRPKDLREVDPVHNRDIPVIPQIIVSDVEEFLILANTMREFQFQDININMGCPFPLQTRLGRGSGLLPHTERVRAILKAIAGQTEEFGTRFSIKMRLGQHNADETASLIEDLNNTPLSHIIVHPRIGVQGYKGEVDMEHFGMLYENLTHPLIYNGDILSTADITHIEQQFPRLAGIMIGRGLLARPSLAAEYAVEREWTQSERRQLIHKMYGALLNHYEQTLDGGEPQLLLKIRTFWEYLESEFGHKAIKKILKSGSMRNYRVAVAALPKQ